LHFSDLRGNRPYPPAGRSGRKLGNDLQGMDRGQDSGLRRDGDLGLNARLRGVRDRGLDTGVLQGGLQLGGGRLKLSDEGLELSGVGLDIDLGLRLADLQVRYRMPAGGVGVPVNPAVMRVAIHCWRTGKILNLASAPDH